MIVTVARTGSTNADLAEAVRAGGPQPEADWLVADRQDAGKGRLGRSWSDGEGNFMGSTVVHPRGGDPPAASLALVAGLALVETLAPLLRGQAPRCLLKWPNDVMLGGGKLAGILLEAVGDAVVVGIGVNLMRAPELADRPATALADHGVSIARDGFAQALAEHFAAELHRWREGGLAPVLRRWQSAAHPIGTPLKVQIPGEEALAGSFAGLADDGALRLALVDGTVRTVFAGDVSLLDSPGGKA